MSTKILSLSIVCFLCFSFVGFSGEVDSLKTIQKKNKKFLKSYPAYVFIPAGKISTRKFYSDTDQSTEIPSNEVPKIEEAAIASFFMYDREVTNINYREFLSYYKIKDPEIYKTLLPDTAVWRKSFSYNDPYVKHYFRHPAYNEFPVLGISYHQAQLYCEWLTELYHQNPERDYKKVIYRLPTEAEWIYVANGGNEAAIYPWEGSYMRASNGDIKANCLNFGSEVVYRDTLYKKDDNGLFQEIAIYRAGPHNLMGAAESLNDGADITAPSKSYWPNAFGLYNMAGNACEMVAEVGITHGGSWNDPGYYSQNHVRQFYTGEDSASSKRGFRFVMEVIEY